MSQYPEYDFAIELEPDENVIVVLRSRTPSDADMEDASQRARDLCGLLMSDPKETTLPDGTPSDPTLSWILSLRGHYYSPWVEPVYRKGTKEPLPGYAIIARSLSYSPRILPDSVAGR